MISTYRKILDLMDARQRRRYYLLMVMMVFVTFAEILGMSMVLVLLRLFAQPVQMLENPYVAWVYQTLGFSAVYPFQIFLSVAVFIVVILGLVIKALGNYVFTRFAAMQGYAMSSRLLQVFLRQPYTWFLSRNSSQISKSVLGEVDQLVSGVMVPANKLLANLMLAAAIVLFITFVDPVVAITAAVLMGSSYALIYLRLRNVLTRIGRELLQANKMRFRLTSEAIGGFKEVKLMSLEDDYVRRFNVPALSRARYTSLGQVVGEIPRFALEALSFGILIGIILILLLRNGGDFLSSVPTLGIIALSVMRLMPAMQQVYGAVASLRGGSVLLAEMHEEYTTALAEAEKQSLPAAPGERLDLTDTLELKQISYSYPATPRTALQEIDLSLRARTTIGIVGGTGAGKTTMVDLILGLLIPDTGQVLVDGVPLGRENMRAWQRSLGYVPQTIYLVDDTVAANIAFGTPPSKIDMAAVERAARVAALHDFVIKDLPQGYKTVVGERGVRLSGGQRQRIGIARAVYHNPSLLVLDEATSALDNITERVVMEAMQNLQGEKTVIMIAHRLSTVRNCDILFLMEHGRIVASGTYEELVQGNETFRRMAVNG